MEGIVLDYGSKKGIIRGADGTRFAFGREDWKSPKDPVAGHKVDFVSENGNAREVYLTNPAAGAVQSLGRSEKTIPTVIYACQAAGFLYGITIIVGVVIAYIYRDGARGTWLYSHYNHQISLFWKSLICGLVCFCAVFFFGFTGDHFGAFFGVAFLVPIIIYIYIITEIIKGWRALAEGKEIS